MYINEIIHKTYIEVDEEGTTAAAVTAIEFMKTGIKYIIKEEIMNVNHPFLFIIRKRDLPSEHDILFISKIEDFQEKPEDKKIKIENNERKNKDISRSKSRSRSRSKSRSRSRSRSREKI